MKHEDRMVNERWSEVCFELVEELQSISIVSSVRIWGDQEFDCDEPQSYEMSLELCQGWESRLCS